MCEKEFICMWYMPKYKKKVGRSMKINNKNMKIIEEKSMQQHCKKAEFNKVVEKYAQVIILPWNAKEWNI